MREKSHTSNITKVTGVLDCIQKIKSLCVPPENEGYPMMVWTIIEYLTETLKYKIIMISITWFQFVQ